MKLNIIVSEKMTEEDKHPYSGERSLIRMTKETMYYYGLKEGNLLNLRTTDNNIITLRIETSFREDNILYNCYVVEEILNSLSLEYLQEVVCKVDKVTGITLGCDPELFLIDSGNGQIIPAGKFFNKQGSIGHDGLLLEIRPTPSPNETVVTNNIGMLIEKAKIIIDRNRKHGNSVSMIATPYYQGVSAGFHLHFGLPNQLLGGLKLDLERIKMVIENVVQILDYYVGIPSVIIEGEEYVRRTATDIQYGKPGSYRLDNITLEYRTPSGYHLRHPILTAGLLGLGLAVVEDIVSRIKICTDNYNNLETIKSEQHIKELYPNVPSKVDLFQLICSKDLLKAKEEINIIFSDIQKMISYNDHKYSIDNFFHQIFINNIFNNNIENNWRKIVYA